MYKTLARCALGVLVAVAVPSISGAATLRTVVIGDSLSAEYDALPNIPGVEDPTAYAAVTVPGWESMSWVEVLGRLRPTTIDLGSFRTALPGWNDLRFTGYKYNFAIPGFTAAQFEDIVNSSLFSNPQYLPYRITLADVLNDEAQACVIWIGANELRADYRFLCEGGNPTNLIKGLRSDISEVVDFVRDQEPSLKVLIVNLPDLGAAPSKQAENPDPAKRQRATEAIALANATISGLAATRGLPIADAFGATRRLIDGQCLRFGATQLHCGSDADNNPWYAFTREGLHPNTGLQIEIARLIISALNQAHGAAIPEITDTEALSLLGINPQQPYLDWAAAHNLANTGPGDDPDNDGLPNIAEFVFGLDPLQTNDCPIRFTASGDSLSASYLPRADRAALVTVTPLLSLNIVEWSPVPPEQITTEPDGRVTIRLERSNRATFLRLQLSESMLSQSGNTP